MELKPGYKLTEVGVIPEDWEVMTVGDIAIVGSGGTPNRKNPDFWGGDIPWITTTQIDGGEIKSAEQYITKSGFESSAAKWYLRGTILMAMYGQGKTRGKTAVLGIDATINQACAAITVSDTVNKKYLLHYLIGCYDKIRELSNSGGQENLNSNIVKSIKVIVPTKAEQTAIANALGDADALIQSLTRLIAKKRQIKQGAMQTLLNPYKNGRLKEGWVVKKFGDVANICRGASPRPIDSPKWFNENSDIGWVRISDITRAKKYLKTTVQKLTAEGVKHSRYVSSNNLLMSICATVGRPILNQIDVCIHDGFVVFGNCTVDKEYLYYYLDSVEQDWAKHGQTGSQMNLNTRLINDTAFPMPKVFTEQTRIATILSGMDTEIAALETKLAKYRHIKQGMMQNLLTGRIRLVKPDSNTGAVA